jgi:hypothetical protein
MACEILQEYKTQELDAEAVWLHLHLKTQEISIEIEYMS